MRPAFLLNMTLLILAGFGSACDSRPPAPKPVEKVEVAGTVLPLADMARQVGGGFVNAWWVVEAGQSLEGILLDSRLKSRLLNSQFVLASGTSDPWSSEGFDDPLRSQRVIRLDLLDTSRKTPNLGLLWLDPLIVEDAARELTARMAIRHPEWERGLFRRRDDFIAEIRALIDEFTPKFEAAQCKALLVLNDDFNPLLYRFGLEPVRAATGSPAQIGPVEMQRMKYQATQKNTRLLIVPADTPEIVQRDLTVRGGLQMVPLDPLGSSAANGRNTYIRLMRYNLEQLARATSIQ